MSETPWRRATGCLAPVLLGRAVRSRLEPHSRQCGESVNSNKRVVVIWCIDMLGRAPALPLSDTLAQHGFDLLPESVIAQRIVVDQACAYGVNVSLRELRSKQLAVGVMPRGHPGYARCRTFGPPRRWKRTTLESVLYMVPSLPGAGSRLIKAATAKERRVDMHRPMSILVDTLEMYRGKNSNSYAPAVGQ